jgi:hypothetical protein
MGIAYDGYRQVAAVRAQLDSLGPTDSSSPSGKALAALRHRLDSLSGSAPDNRFSSSGLKRLPSDFAALHGWLEEQFIAQENGDLAPTETMNHVFQVSCRALTTTVARWHAVYAQTLPEVNSALSKGGKSPLSATPALASPTC